MAASAALATIATGKVVASVEIQAHWADFAEFRRLKYHEKIDTISRARGVLFIVVGTSPVAGVYLSDTKLVRWDVIESNRIGEFQVLQRGSRNPL